MNEELELLIVKFLDKNDLKYIVDSNRDTNVIVVAFSKINQEADNKGLVSN